MATILVIDDEPLVCLTLRTMLSRAGHRVVEAADGIAGMEAFAASLPDIVVMDMMMPRRSGLETIGMLRRLNPALPIIAVSGSGSGSGGDGTDDLLVQAARVGAAATLRKPFRSLDLVAAVNSIVIRADPPARRQGFYNQ